MSTQNDLIPMDIEELKNFIINSHEKYYIELKKASDLPNSFWESYSAFCNTAGGLIILGVKEELPQNEIIGVGNPEKIITDLWNQLSNPNKTSFRSVANEDVSVYTIDDKTIIMVQVNEAPDSMKPVYLNGKIDIAYIRTGDGDRKATKEELAAMLRNAQPGSDNIIADGFTLDDLDKESLITYKAKVSKRYPAKKYLEMTDEEFLSEIGACFVNRKSGMLEIKRGTILFPWKM